METHKNGWSRVYLLVHTPTYKCSETHYMSNHTIFIYWKVVLERSTVIAYMQSPLHAQTCMHKLFPLDFCAVQSLGVNVPGLSPRSITFQDFIQTPSMRFQMFLYMFQSVQACQTSKCCGVTCKLHHLAASVSQTRGRLQGKGESRHQRKEGNVNLTICRGGTLKNHSK